jgi:hypothetical protein
MYADFMSSGLLVVGLLLAFFAWFAIGGRRDLVRREKKLAEFAQKEGFQQDRYTEQILGREVSVTYRDFWPELADEFRVSQGGRLTINHVLHKTWEGGEVTLFDFEMKVGGGGQAALFQSASLNLPRFLVRPGIPSVVGEWKVGEQSVVMLGGLTIETPDQSRVERLFSAESVAFFQRRQPAGRTWAEGHGQRLMYYKLSTGRLASRADLPEDSGIDGFWTGAQDIIGRIAASARAA